MYSSAPTPEGQRRFESFDAMLGKIPDYPHLTKELEETGKMTKFISKDPELQQLELEGLINLNELKMEMEQIHDDYVSNLQVTEASRPKALMDLSLETVVAIMERVGGKTIGGSDSDIFRELMAIMSTVQAVDIEKIMNEENINSSHFTAHSDSLWSPQSGVNTQLLSVSNVPSVAGSAVSGKFNQRHVFPTAAEMMKHTPSNTPASSVFHFTGSSILSTNKAPRLLKPGELAFSESGSPLMMPRLAGLARNAVDATRIPVNDADGKQIVEVVLFKGESDKEKEYNNFVTDVRGLAATKSIRKDRVRPPRVVKAPGSATKTPWL